MSTRSDAAAAGNVVNQVLCLYNGLGQLTREYQAHTGAVDTLTTPSVQYAYSEMAGGANHSRPTAVIYPNGKVLNYHYLPFWAAGSNVNDRISRVSALSDSTGLLERLEYLGAGAVVRRFHEPGAAVTTIGFPTPPSFEQTTQLDRFGRVEHLTTQTSQGAVLDRFHYSYDANSNRNGSTNDATTLTVVEALTHDTLNQITRFQRAAFGTSGAVDEPMGYDAQGNWNTNRSYNRQNELLPAAGATYPSYDKNGNQTRDDLGRSFVYDAWNRLVSTRNAAGALTGVYAYDALGRRISTLREFTTDFYYSKDWQVLEERRGEFIATTQYVWSPVYVDALVLRDRDADGNTANGLEERLWPLQDANWNVTALVNPSLNVIERYLYEPFGAFTVHDANWNLSPTGLSFEWVHLHQGLRYDTTLTLYDNRSRWYDPASRRFIQPDGMGYAAGDTNLYRYQFNSPTGYTDPSGNLVWVPFFIAFALLAGSGALATDVAADKIDDANKLMANPPSPKNDELIRQKLRSAQYWGAAGEVLMTTGAAVMAAPFLAAGFGALPLAGRLLVGGFGIYRLGEDIVDVSGNWNQMEGPERLRRVGNLVGPMVALAGFGGPLRANYLYGRNVLRPWLGNIASRAWAQTQRVFGGQAPSRRIALGIETHLDEFARSHAAESWKQFAKADPMHWKSYFLDVMNDPKAKVLFNLKGVDVWGGVTRASIGKGGGTDWELLQIMQNKEWWSRITWLKDGVKVVNPFE